MPDLTDLLDRTTPRGLPPLDFDRIRRSAAARRRRRRAVPIAAVVVVLIAGLSVAVLRSGHERRVSVAVDGAVLTEPVGAWRQGAAPPFGPGARAFVGTLSDGRVLVWGGGSGAEGGVAEFGGGIYDTEADAWTAIDPAPLPTTVTVHWMQLAGDRLAVLGTDATDGTLLGAVYDVDGGRWDGLPLQDEILVKVDGMAWNGETLALVRVSEGSDGFLGTGVDSRVTAPVTLRWTVGSDAWANGAPSPTGLRFGAAVAFDGDRLALVSGTAASVEGPDRSMASGPDPQIVAGGAVYHLEANTWTDVPAIPGGGAIWPSAAWRSDGALLVGGGNDRLNDPGPDRSTLFAHDLDDGTWTELESAPGNGIRTTPNCHCFSSFDASTLVQAQTMGTSGPQPRSYYGPNGWEEAPLNDLHQLGDLLVATSATRDNPGGDPFRLEVRAAEGVWLDGAATGFTNRMDASVISVGTRLVVVGGYEGPDLTPVGDTWVYDLSP